MKTTLAILLVCAFGGIALFGAFAMLNMAGEISCLAKTAVGGSACPGIAGTAGVAAFHLNLLKSFSSAYVLAWAGLLLFLVAAFAAVRAREDGALPQYAAYAPVHGVRGTREHNARFSRWLALRERRVPSLS